MAAILPPALMRNIADAEAEIVSWSAASGELTLNVRKDVGEESGVLRFRGVGLVHLSPRFTISGIAAVRLTDGDTRFEIAEAWGGTYSVVASAVEYDQDPSFRPRMG